MNRTVSSENELPLIGRIHMHINCTLSSHTYHKQHSDEVATSNHFSFNSSQA